MGAVKRVSFQVGPWELILVVIILLFIFGAKRLKDLARGAGEAVKEFKRATEQPEEKTEDEAIVEVARKMGIETEGKSIPQILEEMKKSAEKKP